MGIKQDPRLAAPEWPVTLVSPEARVGPGSGGRPPVSDPIAGEVPRVVPAGE